MTNAMEFHILTQEVDYLRIVVKGLHYLFLCTFSPKPHAKKAVLSKGSFVVMHKVAASR